MNVDVGFQESVIHSCSENIKCDVGVFECNICFDLAQDPVVTLCGHLFCWSCLHKWLQFHSYSHECPVCKTLVDEDNLVPIYGKGTLSGDSLSGSELPSRPASQRSQTARAPEPSYFHQDGSGATWGSGFMLVATAWLAGSARIALYGAISYGSIFHNRGVDYVISSYVYGGYAHDFHSYPINAQGTRVVFLAICCLFFGFLLVVVMVISSSLFSS